ncbi:MAG: hypothetical protein Q4A37_03190 [Candidatus Saccharibacteria bacterium]|nr:hypothetical protein [Candidatus Saccharibacteria bacterium]
MSSWTEKDFENYTKKEWDVLRQLKLLIDENTCDVAVLQRAHKLSLAVLSIMSHGNGADGLAMSLQEYAYERLEIARNSSHSEEWAKEYSAPIDEFISYGEQKWQD